MFLVSCLMSVFVCSYGFSILIVRCFAGLGASSDIYEDVLSLPLLLLLALKLYRSN